MKSPKYAKYWLLLIVLFTGLVTSSGVFARDAEQRVTFAQPILVVNASFLNVRTGPGIEFTVLVTVVGGSELPALGVAPDGVWYQVATDAGPGWVNVNFTLPRGDFTNLPLVELGGLGVANLGQGGGVPLPNTTTAAPAAVAVGTGVTGVALIGRDIHEQPSFDSLTLNSNVPNDPNTLYPLLGQTTVDGTTWFLVDAPGIARGWTDGVELRILACASENVQVVRRQTPIRFDGIANRDSFLLEVGTEGLFLGLSGINNEFARLQLPDGTVGLVNIDDISNRSSDIVSVCTNVPTVTNPGQGGGADPLAANVPQVTIPQIAGNRLVVNTGNLNIRSGPSAGFSVVGTVPGGTELAVIGRATDNVWFLVEGPFGRGWVNSEFTVFRGSFSTVPVIRDDVVLLTTQQGATTNLGQGGGAPITTTVSSGRQVTGISLIGRNLHQQPSLDSLIISSVVPNDPNTIYPLLQQVTVDGTIWYRVNIPGIGEGWTDGVELRALECGADQVGILTEEQPIRFDGIANRDSFLLPLGTEGFILGRRDDFTIFELVDGTVGLVPAQFVVVRSDDVVSVCDGVPAITNVPDTVTTPNVVDPGIGGGFAIPRPTGNRVVVNTGNLNVRSGPSAGFSVVATVAGGTELAVVGRAADGVWLLIQGPFGQGWVNSEFTLFRGDFGTVPVLDILAN